MFLLDFFYSQSFVFACLLILSGLKINILIILYTLTSIDNYKNKKSIYKISSSERMRELNIDSTLWAAPAKIINLLDFDSKKTSIDTELNSISNTPDASSKDLVDIHEVRYDDGGFYLVIDDIKGYFNLSDNTSGILDMILTDDQKNKYHQVWKEVFKNVNEIKIARKN